MQVYNSREKYLSLQILEKYRSRLEGDLNLYKVKDNKYFLLIYSLLYFFLKTKREKQPFIEDLIVKKISKKFIKENDLINKINYVGISSLGCIVDYIFQYDMENFEIGNIKTLNSRKKHGVYFTPYFIAEYITRETINFSSNFRTLDPACGTGVFLSAAAHLMNISGIKHEEIIDNLFGFDINSEAIIISKIIIGMELGLDNKLFKRFIINDKNFKKVDTILMEYPQKNLFNFSKHENYEGNKFDFIITNPPFDRLKPDILKSKDHSLMMNYIKKVKSTKNYELSSYGSLDLYKLFLEKITKISSYCKGKVGIIIPGTFTSDKSCKILRKHLLQKHMIEKVIFIPEKLKAFSGVTQSFVILLINNNRKQKERIYKIKTFTLNNLKELNKVKFSVINYEKLENAFYQDLNIADLSEEGYDLIEKLNSFITIKTNPKIVNMRGEVDLTHYKNLLNKGQNKLLRGKHISEFNYTTKADLIDYKKFLSIIKNSLKYDHVFQKRLVCQQISNMDSKKRLKFALVEEEILLGNSLNYIISDISEDFIFGLYSIFNSILLDWRFCITSSNNHVNNYELDNLPLPKNSSDIIILGKYLKRNIKNIFENKFRKSLEYKVLEIYDCSKYANFLINNHPKGKLYLRNSINESSEKLKLYA